VRWNVIAQIGKDDYYPDLDAEEVRIVATIDKTGDNTHDIAHNLLSNVFTAGLSPSQVAIDLLHIAAIAYTADLRIWRGYNSDDAWSREISIYAPVTDVGLWNAASPKLTELLCFLTGDEWTVNFRAKLPTLESTIGNIPHTMPDGVCLFSGGLDSYVGAIDLLAAGKNLALVGHYGRTQREQVAAYESLNAKYGAQMLPLWFFLVPPRSSDEQRVELTMRARSLLFLALGTSVTSALPSGAPLYIPENGLISLNIPLTFGRTGTHSTRTTHPHTISLYRKLLDALGIRIALHTPYRFMTKGEMLRDCKDQEILKSGIHSTMSCSRPQAGRFHHRPVGQHCGYCVPCIIRRASLHSVGLDSETRLIDVLSPDIRANQAAGYDKRAFLMAIARLRGMSSLQITCEIMAAGPLDTTEVDALTGVFVRGTEEVNRFLRQKP
jgi:7-cyano-7-deazaguanine synthase in queuosine biosynthesis